MLREFGTVCLAPVVMVGYLTTFSGVHPGTMKHPTEDSGVIVQAQTCEKGFGADIKVSSIGYYGADLQYGFHWEPVEKYSVTLTPRLGISHVDHPVRELPQATQFGLGGALTLGYERARVGVEWWHLSNGKALGLNVYDGPNQNIGIDMLVLTVGWSF